MRRSSIFAASGAVLAAILVFGARFGVGQDRDMTPPQDVITGEFALVETQSGVLTLLRHPTVRSLGGRACLVGRAQPLGIGDAESAFDTMEQWIFLDDIRRLGELKGESEVRSVRDFMAILRRDRERSQAR